MEKIIQFLTNTQGDAFTVVETLKKLDDASEISVSEIYVLEKDDSGRVTLKNSEGSMADNTLLGTFTGGLLGLLGGPAGFLLGSSLGLLTGSLFDLSNADDAQFYLDKVSKKIPDGKSLVVAHLYEDWESPVDAKLSGIAQITRVNVDEEIEKEFDLEIEKLNKEIDETEADLKQSAQEKKKELQDKLDTLKTKRDTRLNEYKNRLAIQKKAYKKWFEKIKSRLNSK